MRGAPDTMEVLRPRTAAEAIKAYALKPHAQPLAGGTDFMVLWNLGQFNNRVVLDLSGLKEWKQIKKTAGGLQIGSLITHAQIQEHPIIRKEFPLLVEACATVGAAQIQNRGTIGGNIANASPAGDTFPPLALYEPTVNVVSPAGKSEIPFSSIFAGVKKTSLGPAELIESITLPFIPRPSRQIFRKVGTRLAQAISKTMAAGALWLEKDGTVKELRFALGSMAPTVRRLKTVEAYVRGRKLAPETVEEACRKLREDVSPIDDIRSTAQYRLQVSENILRRFLNN